MTEQNSVVDVSNVSNGAAYTVHSAHRRLELTDAGGIFSCEYWLSEKCVSTKKWETVYENMCGGKTYRKFDSFLKFIDDCGYDTEMVLRVWGKKGKDVF